METINEVVIANLKALRGDESQEAFAHRAGIPYRTYQDAENGTIPKGKTLKAIARTHRVPESRIFLDPDLMQTRRPTPAEALEVLREALEIRGERSPVLKAAEPEQLESPAAASAPARAREELPAHDAAVTRPAAVPSHLDHICRRLAALNEPQLRTLEFQLSAIEKAGATRNFKDEQKKRGS